MVKTRARKAKTGNEVENEQVSGTLNQSSQKRTGKKMLQKCVTEEDVGESNCSKPSKRAKTATTNSQKVKSAKQERKKNQKNETVTSTTTCIEKETSMEPFKELVSEDGRKLPNKTTVLTESKYFKETNVVGSSPLSGKDSKYKSALTQRVKLTPKKLNTEPEFSIESVVCKDNNVSIAGSFEDMFLGGLISQGLHCRRKIPVITNSHPQKVFQTSINLMHCMANFSLGYKSRLELMQSLKSPIVKIVQDLSLKDVSSPFDRRVTALEWHPTKHNVLAVGSKGGDIVKLDIRDLKNFKMIQGIGAAGSCQAMKFWPWDMEKMVSASINGTVTLHDFDLQSNTVLADTMNSYDHWYTSLDVNASCYMIAAGRNCGILHLMSSEGNKIFENKMHKGKITHVEFSHREEWLLCTASVDQTVALWDIRNMKDKKSSLQTLPHNKPVNAAYFSPIDGCRLLTTDQGCEIRVYESPAWHQRLQIQHPHRFFQHITPFKATWHPLKDLIVCGRYPDSNFSGVDEPRSVDVMDANTGGMVYQLQHPNVSGLCPLNKFNPCGDMLASGMGFHIMLWDQSEAIKKSVPLLSTKLAGYLGQSHDTDLQGERSSKRSRPQKKKKTNEDTDDLKKKKTKVTESTTVKLKKRSKKEN